MADPLQKLTRRQLYEKIWKTSVNQVSKELGITSYRLTKLCNQHKVPRPTQGHWKRLELGLPTEEVPLPELDDHDLEEIYLFREQFEQKTPKPAKPTVIVPEALTAPHKLITATQRHFKHAKAAENGKVCVDTKVSLDIHVTPAALDRTLRIYDTLIKHWESIGGSVHIGVEGYNEKRETVFRLKNASARVAVIEVVHRKELPRKPVRELYEYSPREFTYHPTGKLQFEINGFYGSRCCDGNKQNLEATPLILINSIRKDFEKMRIEELDRACRKRQELELDRIRSERKERKEQEEARRKSLLRDFANWKKAGEIRQYLAALRSRVDSGLHPAKEEQRSEAWFKWAHWYADVCDPLVATAPRNGLTQPRTNSPIEKLDLTHSVRQALIRLGTKDCDDLSALSLSRFKTAHGRNARSGWNELAGVLVIHGYDVSEREEAAYGD